MTVSTYHKGNKIIWNEEEKEWYYTDGSKANYFKIRGKFEIKKD